jgi:hypothetical protein
MQPRFHFLFLFLLILCFAIRAKAATFENVGALIKETCRYYDGSPLSTFITPETPGQMDNPLTVSPLGQKLLVRNLKSAYLDYNYLSRDAAIQFLIDSPEFNTALDECYGNNEMAKLNFTLFLRKIEIEGKTLAFYAEALTWIGEGAIFLKAGAWLSHRFQWIKTILVWSKNAVIPVTTLYAGNAVYHYIQYKRGKLQRVPLGIDGKVTKEVQRELEASRDTAMDCIRDLESQRQLLRKQILETTDPKQKKKLVDLDTETSELIFKLKQQLR